MNTRKIVVALALVALVATGAFAQLTLGVSGALHMDEQMSASEIKDSFDSGENIFYGAFAEIIIHKLGFGVSGNFSSYTDMGTEFMDYDVNGYLSLHLFGGRAFLDPFGEFGVGVFAYDFADNDTDPDNPIAANLYWYAAAGLGINLGPVGVFGKFAYNVRINRHLTGTNDDGSEYDIPYYGYPVYNSDTEAWDTIPLLPQYRFTLGIKLIL